MFWILQRGIFQCQPHFSSAKDSLKTHSSPFSVGSRCQQLGERGDYTSNTDTLKGDGSAHCTYDVGILERDNSREPVVRILVIWARMYLWYRKKLSVSFSLVAETCKFERSCYRRCSGTSGGDWSCDESCNSCPRESVHAGPVFDVRDVVHVAVNRAVSTHD
ncbi:uncharacterized protein K444DRAFT_140410 [Hyaloscypha bicolor E]|uniref:Uncharacterized protein n=1 Tax=Hyaloscypha bicolor E TaxID=1095630 RepID=A0A2J6SUD3_9HELO|nr:uncharacterized protein K444DRAFT_140410 [Hyaloscypha bicolor E]PMD54293.1 hypothetical protein K444DRAFT_140410 [Hyaloscypha bicolor E]